MTQFKPPAILHAHEMPALEQPTTAGVFEAEGSETWHQRLAHPYREDMEVYIDDGGARP